MRLTGFLFTKLEVFFSTITLISNLSKEVIFLFDIQAHIHSLNGGLDTVTIVEHKDNNHVIVKYHGKYYTAVFNPFVGQYFVDDKFGLINDIDNFKF